MTSWTATITTSSAYPGDRTQVWTNFGPLTTAFVPPAYCKTDPAKEGLVEIYIQSGSTTVTSFDCGQANLYYIQYPNCYPSSKGMSVLQTNTNIHAGYWSPGLVCPSGWSTGYAQTYGPDHSRSLGVDVNSLIGNDKMAATQVICCPRFVKELLATITYLTALVVTS